MTTQRKWYLAKLVYQVVNVEGPHNPHFDEQLRLIQAEELDWAREKAKVLGQIGAFTCTPNYKGKVNRKFIDVVDIYEIGEIEDGAQLYNATVTPKDILTYLDLITTKSKSVYDFTKEQTSFY